MRNEKIPYGCGDIDDPARVQGAGVSCGIPLRAEEGEAAAAVWKHGCGHTGGKTAVLCGKMCIRDRIRVQLSHAGMPLLGDARYGSAESREYGESLGIRSVCLCACRLCFTHPITGERLEFRTEEMPWKRG